MKTIKVIELLNKIHNDSPIPYRVKYKGVLYTYDENVKDYNNTNFDFLFAKIFRYEKDATNEELIILESNEEQKEEFHLYTEEELDNMTTKEIEEVLIEQLKILGEQLHESIFKKD